MNYHRCPGCSAMTKRRTVCDSCLLHFAQHPHCQCERCNTTDEATTPTRAVVNVVSEAAGLEAVNG